MGSESFQNGRETYRVIYIHPEPVCEGGKATIKSTELTARYDQAFSLAKLAAPNCFHCGARYTPVLKAVK